MFQYLNKLYSKDIDSYFKELRDDLKNKKKRFIITVNPETLMYSERDDVIREIMEQDYSYVPDGIAVVKAARMCNIDIKSRITGIDIMEYLLSIADNNKYSIYLFGATKKVINDLVSVIKNKYSNIKILGFSDGYAKDKDAIMRKIVKLKPDICFIGMGIPMQEKLIYKYYNSFNKGIFIGVGGSFDVLSGNKKRAPKIFIKLNLEWLYRIIKEPKRLKRFINNNILFLWKVRRDINK